MAYYVILNADETRAICFCARADDDNLKYKWGDIKDCYMWVSPTYNSAVSRAWKIHQNGIKNNLDDGLEAHAVVLFSNGIDHLRSTTVEYPIQNDYH